MVSADSIVRCSVSERFASSSNCPCRASSEPGSRRRSPGVPVRDAWRIESTTHPRPPSPPACARTEDARDPRSLRAASRAPCSRGHPARRRAQQGADGIQHRADLLRPLAQRHVPAPAPEHECRLAAAGRHRLLIVLDVETVLIADGIAVAHQAEDQECLQEAHLVFVDAAGIERGDVQRAYLDVFDAALRRARRWVSRRSAPPVSGG